MGFCAINSVTGVIMPLAPWSVGCGFRVLASVVRSWFRLQLGFLGNYYYDDDDDDDDDNDDYDDYYRCHYIY